MIYLVRHGETDWNLFKKFNGCTETELNQTGIEQSKLQAENLKNIHFDVCFSSPQKRAHQACQIICNDIIIPDNRLTEIDCGEFEGTEETLESMGLFWEACTKGHKGVERFKEFLRRNCDFCDMVMKKYRGKNVLIVTHAANVRVINYYFTGKQEDYDFKIAVSKKGGLLTYENS